MSGFWTPAGANCSEQSPSRISQGGNFKRFGTVNWSLVELDCSSLKSNSAAVAFWRYWGPRIFVTFATLNNCRSSYACWLLDLLRKGLINYIEVWFSLSISSNGFENNEIIDAFFTRKWCFFFRICWFFKKKSKIIYYCSEFNAGQKLRCQVQNFRYFSDNTDVSKKVFDNIACSTSPPGVNLVDGLPPVLNLPINWNWRMRKGEICGQGKIQNFKESRKYWIICQSGPIENSELPNRAEHYSGNLLKMLWNLRVINFYGRRPRFFEMKHWYSSIGIWKIFGAADIYDFWIFDQSQIFTCIFYTFSFNLKYFELNLFSPKFSIQWFSEDKSERFVLTLRERLFELEE